MSVIGRTAGLYEKWSKAPPNMAHTEGIIGEALKADLGVRIVLSGRQHPHS